MADRASAEQRQTYLVEHYRPGVEVDVFKQWAARVRDTAAAMEGEGKPVRYVRAAIVPADESLLCVLEAADEELVRATYARAGIPFERLSTVIREGGDGWAAHTDVSREEGR
jgi:Protein of unknown function (DUF4242)